MKDELVGASVDGGVRDEHQHHYIVQLLAFNPQVSLGFCRQKSDQHKSEQNWNECSNHLPEN